MADLLKNQEEFKKMLDENGKSYKDFGNGLIMVATDDGMINIRQYYDDYCLSSWLNIKTFKENMNKLLEV